MYRCDVQSLLFKIAIVTTTDYYAFITAGTTEEEIALVHDWNKNDIAIFSKVIKDKYIDICFQNNVLFWECSASLTGLTSFVSYRVDKLLLTISLPYIVHVVSFCTSFYKK